MQSDDEVICVFRWENPRFEGSDEGVYIDSVTCDTLEEALHVSRKWLEEAADRKVEIVRTDASILQDALDLDLENEE